MENRWTPAQFSVMRAVIGSGLTFAFVWTLATRWASTAEWERITLAAGGLLSVAVAMGFLWRLAAALLVIPAVVASLHGLPEGAAALGMVIILMLALALMTPPAPAASPRPGTVRSREAPAPLAHLIWLALAAGHMSIGAMGLLGGQGPAADPVTTLTWIAQLAFGPLALLRPARPFAWAVVLLLLMLEPILRGIGEPLPGGGVLLLHLLAFDPRWIRPAGTPGAELILFDGQCGLCHRAVRFVLSEDLDGIFRFAPVQGPATERLLTESERVRLSNSAAVRCADGRLLVRSAATVHTLRRLGGLWGVLGVALWLIPAPLRDMGYRAVAGLRGLLFRRPATLCPRVPEHLSGRFVMR